MTSQFGPLLRQLRRRVGMTQEELADRAEVSVRTIRGFETGKQANPRADTVTRLADALAPDPVTRAELLAAALGADTPQPSAVVVPDRLAEPADDLARAVVARWQREEEQRRIQDPSPLPVRWEQAAEELTDHWANICRVPVGDTSGPLELAGRIDDIVPVYRRIPSGRLVVLGRAGSGKTILALRFVLDLLAARAPADPVPVIVGLGSWNPTTTALRDWLIGQLVRDHPGLATPGPGGSTVAAALVEAGRILPVLDGFDEIADGLHRPALEALNATTLPLVLTSRREQYSSAVAVADVLTAAAAVEVVDLTLADAGEYLRRTARRSTATAWDTVLAALDRDPDGLACVNLTAVLTTPLMVTLARTVYSDTGDGDPAVLLDTDRFADPEALEDHLLDSFVPIVYQRPPVNPAWELHDVLHWLATLARHLDRLGTRDIAWWQIGNPVGRRTGVLVTGLAAGLVLAVVDLIAQLVITAVVSGARGIDGGLTGIGIITVLVGLLGGVMFGLMHGHVARHGVAALGPARFELRLIRRRHEVLQRFLARLGVGMVGGLAFGLGYGLLTALFGWLLSALGHLSLLRVIEVGLVNSVVYAIVVGLGAGLVGGLIAGFEVPLDTASAVSPVDLLLANRRTMLAQLVVWVPVFGLVIGFGPMALLPLLQPFLGPLVWPLPAALQWAAAAGLGGGLAYLLSLTAWGQWVLFCRVLLPLRGRLPWALVAFLDDAYRRGVLRQAGAVYQFRHARLQDRLTVTERSRSTRR